MRIVLSTILVFAITSFQLSEVAIYVVFKINQESIAKNLCVEKDIENSTCKGCCQLKKRVAENNEQKREASTVQDKPDLNLYFPTHRISTKIYQDIKDLICLHISAYSFITDQSFFHPPPIVAVLV